jgi:hypothetical protein
MTNSQFGGSNERLTLDVGVHRTESSQFTMQGTEAEFGVTANTDHRS